MTPVEIDERLGKEAEDEDVVVVVVVVELNGMKKGALAWVTRPNPVKVAGFPNLVVIRYQRTSQ